MYPTYLLEWWFEGRWNVIGWIASTPRSAHDLRQHGQRLADERGDRYRLVTPGILADEPPTVVYEFTKFTKEGRTMPSKPTRAEVFELAREIEPPSKRTEVSTEWGALVLATGQEEADLIVVYPNTRKNARRFAAGDPNRIVVRRDVTVTTIATPWEKP